MIGEQSSDGTAVPGRSLILKTQSWVIFRPVTDFASHVQGQLPQQNALGNPGYPYLAEPYFRDPKLASVPSALTNVYFPVPKLHSQKQWVTLWAVLASTRYEGQDWIFAMQWCTQVVGKIGSQASWCSQ